VQTDKTSEALTEFFKELNDIGKPIGAEELTKAKNYIALSFPGEFETLGDLAGHIEEMVVYSLPETYFATYVQNIQSVTSEAVQKAAADLHSTQALRRRRRWRSQDDRAGHSRAEPRAGPRRVGQRRDRTMSVPVDFNRLMDYVAHERGKWKTWLEADPSRLTVSFQEGMRFPTINGLLDHVFWVERRHLSRLQGVPLPDKTDVAEGDIAGLFAYADRAHADPAPVRQQPQRGAGRRGDALHHSDGTGVGEPRQACDSHPGARDQAHGAARLRRAPRRSRAAGSITIISPSPARFSRSVRLEPDP
jgi:hypothetical protein